jgi:hypothetical protein
MGGRAWTAEEEARLRRARAHGFVLEVMGAV